MNKKLLIGIFLSIWMFTFYITFCSAEQQGQDLSFGINSNNATKCNVTNVEVHGTNNYLYYLNIPMTQLSQSFNITIDKGNFSNLGEYCFNLQCTDGINIETGSRCFNITPSGIQPSNSSIALFLVILLIIYGIVYLGFFSEAKNPIISLLGGLAMMALGIYMINNGVIIYRDWMTNYLAYVTITLGAIASIVPIVEWIEDSI